MPHVTSRRYVVGDVENSLCRVLGYLGRGQELGKSKGSWTKTCCRGQISCRKAERQETERRGGRERGWDMLCLFSNQDLCLSHLLSSLWIHTHNSVRGRRGVSKNHHLETRRPNDGILSDGSPGWLERSTANVYTRWGNNSCISVSQSPARSLGLERPLPRLVVKLGARRQTTSQTAACPIGVRRGAAQCSEKETGSITVHRQSQPDLMWTRSMLMLCPVHHTAFSSLLLPTKFNVFWTISGLNAGSFLPGPERGQGNLPTPPA